MPKECLYPEISGTAVCLTEQIGGKHATYLCCKGCSKQSIALLEMAKVPELDAHEIAPDSTEEAIVHALIDKNIAVDPYDDNYPRVPSFNILNLLGKH